MTRATNGKINDRGRATFDVGVVICSPDAQRAQSLAEALSNSGFAARVCRAPAQIAPIAEGEVLVLDAAGRFSHALATCLRTRRLYPERPLIVVSNQNDTLEKAKLLEVGADLLLVEPFSMRELMASVYALNRRESGVWRKATVQVPALAPSPASERPDSSPLAHDWQQAARSLNLTETERVLLGALLESKGPLANTRLLEAISPGTTHQADSTHLRVHVSRLRQKLLSVGLTIKAFYGRGYRIVGVDEGWECGDIDRA